MEKKALLRLRQFSTPPPPTPEPDASPHPPAKGLRPSYVRKSSEDIEERRTSSPQPLDKLTNHQRRSIASFSNIDPGRLTTAELKVEVTKLLSWLDEDHEELTSSVGMAAISGITDNIERRLDRLNKEIQCRVQREAQPLEDEYRRQLSLRLEALKAKLKSWDAEKNAAVASVRSAAKTLLGRLHEETLVRVDALSSVEALLSFKRAHQRRVLGISRRATSMQFADHLPSVGYGCVTPEAVDAYKQGAPLTLEGGLYVTFP